MQPCSPRDGKGDPSNGLLEITLSSWNYRSDLVREHLDTFERQNPDIEAIGPERGTYGGIETYALAVGAKNPHNGWRVLHFLTEQEAATTIIDKGYVIPARRAFAKEHIAANAGKPPANIVLAIESLDHATQENKTLDTVAARRMYRGDNINEIWDGKVTAKEGLMRVRAAVEEAVAPK